MLVRHIHPLCWPRVTQCQVLCPDAKDAKPNAFFSFSGDAEEGEDLIPPGGEDVAIDLFAQAKAAVDAADAADAAEADNDEDGEGEDDDEPEDDFNAAWEVLDLARSLFDQKAANNDEVRLKLADTYIALGDVSLETEKFEQAIADYETGLKHKEELLPSSSRQLAEAHYKLGLVLDLTSGRLSDAITHIRRALDCTDARLSELREGLANAPATAPEPTLKEEAKEDAKGKGKATGRKLVRDPVSGMSKGQVESEIKDLEEVIAELKLKVHYHLSFCTHPELTCFPQLEELASPNDADEDASATASAPLLAARELDAALNAPTASGPVAPNAIVNDLTGMVKKKKKEPVANGLVPPEKRKAEDEGPSPTEKKPKLDEATPAP